MLKFERAMVYQMANTFSLITKGNDYYIKEYIVLLSHSFLWCNDTSINTSVLGYSIPTTTQIRVIRKNNPNKQ